jgi:hypothetical protein
MIRARAWKSYLARLCDPQDAQFALNRPDFHYVQTFTLVIGTIA